MSNDLTDYLKGRRPTKKPRESPQINADTNMTSDTHSELEALREEVRALKEQVECLATDQRAIEECFYRLSFPDKDKLK